MQKLTRRELVEMIQQQQKDIFDLEMQLKEACYLLNCYGNPNLKVPTA